MSTVQDEAEAGPVETLSETENSSFQIQEANINNYGPIEFGTDAERHSSLGWEEAGDEEREEVGKSSRHGKKAEDYANSIKSDESSIEASGGTVASKAQEKPSSADGSLSTPDDTPSVQNSLVSSRGDRLGLRGHGQSPTPSLRPFDRRFQARLSPSPLNTPRATSPSFLTAHSRQSSVSSQLLQGSEGADTPDSPWEVIRWTKLRKITGQAFSESGKRNFGRPTCIAISSSIALGTSRGIILIFDYHQNLKGIIGPGTKVAGGHATGNIFTWEIARPAKPFLYIPSTDRSRARGSEFDGHVSGVAILHLGFLGTRHTALVSADDKGMAFSHLATRGMGLVARSIRTTRILGRYPDFTPDVPPTKKPSSVLAFSPLPLGVTEHSTDLMGLVALLTPYLLVIVSTTPVAQTQHKVTKPKEIAVHGAMSAALAWFPAVQDVEGDALDSESLPKIKLAYCWSNVLMLLDVMDMDVSRMNDKDKPPELHFKPRKRWKAEEAIVAIQWLSRSVLAVMTITQQLIILEDASLHVTDSFDLIKKHVYHADLFSQQLSPLIERLDEEDMSMHGVVADAFYMSFRAYKGRLFLLGFNDVSVGTLSNWADRLLALMEQGDFIGAIKLATSYYDGEAEKATIGLPEDSGSRHTLVREKLLEMMSASLRYAFGKNAEAGTTRLPELQLKELAAACFHACNSIGDMEFLFEDVYAWYSDGDVQGILLEILEPSIKEGRVKILPPSVVKDLINHFVDRQWAARLEELLCDLDPSTMDIDQITTLCRTNRLYDALLYLWSQALGDYTTVLQELMDMQKGLQSNGVDEDTDERFMFFDPTSKIFPYLSYILTGRIYPTGDQMHMDKATMAKADIYSFLFSGSNSKANGINSTPTTESLYPSLESVLDIDAPSFLSVMNEAFEDSFLNNSDESGSGKGVAMTTEQRFGLSLNRQYIVSILLEVMNPPRYGPEDIVYMNMFVARNLPKFPQYILLPGSVLHKILVDLCNYSSEDVEDDCQLSVEYLLSVYRPPDLPSLIALFSRARFYRVMKSIYKAERQYDLLLQTCFEDHEDPEAVFGCIADCLRPGAGLNEKQLQTVRDVVAEHAREMVSVDLSRAASTIQQYAPDLHGVLLDAIGDDEHAQFQYLQAVLEPQEVEGVNPQYRKTDNRFVELYVRLLCEFEPHHVSKYIERLKVGDLRLEEVLPALENSGVIDAAVVLLAREGKVREALDRLVQYLMTLEAALIGLLDGAESAPDPGNIQETAGDLVESFDKFVRVGIWLCQGQSKSIDNSRAPIKHLNSNSSSGEGLSANEVFWVDLIDAVVQVTRNVGELLDTQYPADGLENPDKTRQSSKPQKLDAPNLLRSLRKSVQDAFTALLATTSIPPANEPRHKNMAFLRILRTFLNRASLSSPSLSNLRAVLAAVFSAYSYEESLLDLANRLLDKDLFVHVSEVTVRRKRGWRPLGQVCEGCGKRVWGPGAGEGIWDAWVERGQRATDTGETVDFAVPRSESSKGKAVAKSDDKHVDSRAMIAEDMHDGPVSEESSPLIIFSCRHIFHQTCLKGMQTTARDGDGDTGPSKSGYSCPLCK
ncbi:MAG: hypothetical protein Q9187_005365 [Circinaria calcarea]